MDEQHHRALFKKYFDVFGDKVLEEVIQENVIQFRIQRGAFYFIISSIDAKPLCEIVYPCPFDREEDIVVLSGLIRDPGFLLEFRKLVTAPDILYTFDIKNGQFNGFSILSRIYKKPGEITLDELSHTIMNVMNYGILAGTFISVKTGKTDVGQKYIPADQKNIDNPMFY